MTDPEIELQNLQYRALMESPLFVCLLDRRWIASHEASFVPKEPLKAGDIRVLVEGQEFVFLELQLDGLLICADPRGTYSTVMVDWQKVSAFMKFRDM